MNEMSFERDLRELLSSGPRTAAPSTLDRAIAIAATMPQRHPRVARLDRRAWPPMRGSVSDPTVFRVGRLALAAIVVLLVGVVLAVGARLLERPPSIDLTSAGQLGSLLRAPSATLWVDGRVLVRGDTGTQLLFDPANGRSEELTFNIGWSLAQTTVLPDGRVVLTKRSEVNDQVDASVDVAFYDVETGEIHPTGSFRTPWLGQATVVLHDGRIVISGGIVPSGDADPCSLDVCDGGPAGTSDASVDMSEGAKALVEVFDPATGRTTEAGHLLVPRGLHQMVELDGGRVLVLGGGDYGADPTSGGEAVSVEVFDLDTGTSSLVGTLAPSHYPGLPNGIRLADGRILISGGGVSEYPYGIPSFVPGQPAPQVPQISRQPTYVFDPASNRLTKGPVLPHFYGVENVVPLRDGRALAFGEYPLVTSSCRWDATTPSNPWLAVIDIARDTVYDTFDPMTGSSELSLAVPRVYGAAVALPDGRVALIGDEPGTYHKNEIDLVAVAP